MSYGFGRREDVVSLNRVNQEDDHDDGLRGCSCSLSYAFSKYCAIAAIMSGLPSHQYTLHRGREMDSPRLGRTVLAGHEHTAVGPNSVRFVHRVEEAAADGDVAGYERLDLVFGECEAGEEKRHYRLATVDVLSVVYIISV